MPRIHFDLQLFETTWLTRWQKINSFIIRQQLSKHTLLALHTIKIPAKPCTVDCNRVRHRSRATIDASQKGADFQAETLRHPREKIPLFFVRGKQTEYCGALCTKSAPDETRATFALHPSTAASVENCLPVLEILISHGWLFHAVPSPFVPPFLFIHNFFSPLLLFCFFRRTNRRPFRW